jgi:hypothetical protein
MKFPDDLFVLAGVLDAFKSDLGAISLMLNTYLGAVERRSPVGIEKDLWDPTFYLILRSNKFFKRGATPKIQRPRISDSSLAKWRLTLLRRVPSVWHFPAGTAGKWLFA